MHPGLNKALGAAVLAPGLLVLSLLTAPSSADEPRGLGRFFRLGGSPAPTTPAPPSAPNPGASIVADTGAPPPVSAAPNPGVAVGTAPSGGIAASPRIVAQPRVTRPVTEADPLVSRLALVRSNDGNQFGVFLQVFADGTIIDGEGVHRVGRDVLKPLIDVLQEADLSKIKGHCGAPATDYTEYVHLIVFERSFGKLRASSFSYSGNPQGCDHTVHRLHAALDTLQTKISRPPTVATGPVSGTTSSSGNSAAIPLGPANSIPLTPLN